MVCSSPFSSAAQNSRSHRTGEELGLLDRQVSHSHREVFVSSGVASEVVGVKSRPSSTRVGRERDRRDCDVDGTGLGSLLEDMIALELVYKMDRLKGCCCKICIFRCLASISDYATDSQIHILSHTCIRGSSMLFSECPYQFHDLLEMSALSSAVTCTSLVQTRDCSPIPTGVEKYID